MTRKLIGIGLIVAVLLVMALLLFVMPGAKSLVLYVVATPFMTTGLLLGVILLVMNRE